jgi:nitrate reductase gamma subunit
MTLLDFARGPAMNVAIAVLVAGSAWRLVALLLLPRARDRSVGRPGAPWRVTAAATSILSHMKVAKGLGPVPRFAVWNAYAYHIGLFVIVFFFTQHILVWEGLVGLSWPGLPTGVITVASVITLAALVAALVRRVSSPILRLLSGFDDYFSWLLTTLPVLTGLLAQSHLFLRYDTMLALHILSVAAMLIWFPFGKLFHGVLVWVTRGRTGAFYGRRGVAI